MGKHAEKAYDFDIPVVLATHRMRAQTTGSLGNVNKRTVTEPLEYFFTNKSLSIFIPHSLSWSMARLCVTLGQRSLGKTLFLSLIKVITVFGLA